MTLRVTDNSFEQDVVQADGPVLVDLWAEWCGPCRAIAPVLDDLQQDLGDSVTIAKVNVDENPETARRLAIRSIPTLLLFNQGKIVDSAVGVQSKSALETMIKPYLAAAS